MIEALKGLDPSFAAQRARVHAAMAFDPKLFYTAGTNLKGVHGKGGALFAKESFGLPMHQFEGIYGRTIAVPTRTGPPITTLSAEEIRQSLIRYRNTLQANPDKTALLPPIGMGNAGIAPDKMLGMMDDAGLMQMENQIVPTSEMVLKGFPETAARLRLIEGMKRGTMPATKKSLVNTSFVGPMNFPIMGAKTIKSRTTFDAITAGERTMTTRKVGQGWENRKVGEVFPITGKGNQQQLIQITDDPVMYTVTGKESQAFLNRWAELEGHGPEQFNRLFTQGQKITMVKYRPIRTQNLKFISGGQIGADRIGLEKAKEWGIATGGTAPKGFKIQGGHDTSLRRFGLKEHPSADYRPRTKLNVENSDGTLIISTQNRASSGSKLTERYAREGNKPLLINPRSADEIHQWMVSNNIQTLNIAGNRKIYVDNPIWGYLEEAIKPLM